jgi:hypothetical protein
MKNEEMKDIAVQLIDAFDAGDLDWTGIRRTAESLSEFYVESLFSVPLERYPNEAECELIFEQVRQHLVALGLS